MISPEIELSDVNYKVVSINVHEFRNSHERGFAAPHPPYLLIGEGWSDSLKLDI